MKPQRPVSSAPAGSRRDFLARFAAGSLFFTTPGAFAEALIRTPRQTAGPFYPDHLPLDTDNDLIILNDSITPAVGQITHLTGRVTDLKGDPIRNAVIEIWQTDANGIYLHSADQGHGVRDGNFQGFGRFLTGSTGEYYFRTLRPVPYGAGGITRTPHIHFAVRTEGRSDFTTQCYIRGEKLNQRDGVLNAIRDPRQRESVIVDFKPIPDSPGGELAAKFDIVLGFTPA